MAVFGEISWSTYHFILSLIVILYCQSVYTKSVHGIRVAVIGAGAGGLTSIHQITKSIPSAEIIGFDVNEDVGGSWIYTDKVGKDEFGLPLTTSMYKNLRTNLPRQVMEFKEFPIPSYHKSFMTHKQYLQYLKNYATNFDLRKYIKFRHIVTLVKSKDDDWEVTYINLLTENVFTEVFDYVFVCNGHYSKQYTPNYKGQNVFKGVQMHSGDYREPEPFKDKSVLIIGSGPSGMDISIEVARFAKKVILSHHYPKFESPFPSNYIQRKDVKEFRENSVVFVDNVVEDIDNIVYCTGFWYDIPFLDPSCNISTEKTHVSNLYKHIINIEHPTMFFIGIPHLCCGMPLMEMQASYAVAAIRGDFKLPSKKEMYEHMENDYNSINKTLYKVERVATHMLGKREPLYIAELYLESGVSPVPPVMTSIRSSTMSTRKNLYIYRDYEYKVLDGEHFLRIYEGGPEYENNEVRGSPRCTVHDFFTKYSTSSKIIKEYEYKELKRSKNATIPCP